MSHLFRFLVSKVFWINLLVAILLVGGGVYATLLYLDNYTKHGEELEVPEFVGIHISETDLVITDQESFFTEISDSVFIKGEVGGTVIEQHPPAGKQVKQGRTIYLTVAANQPTKIKMPKLVDRSLRQATSILETYGLEVGELVYKPDMCTNCILQQKLEGEEIAEGTRIRKGSVIDLVVGQGLGSVLVEVPYLLEFNIEMATNLLQSKSLNLGAPLFDETVKTAEDSINAVVYKQLPPFSQVPTTRMGVAVDLFLTLDTNKVVHSFIPVLDSIQ